MADFEQFQRGLSQRARWSLGIGATLIALLVAAASWWVLRPSYAVLFSALSEQDAASVAQELEKLKVPYQLTEQANDAGQIVLVPEASVHKTRIMLMGRQLPLQGVVGFELFNSADFGVSDFVQKVNYQRAFQGELTRTILAIEQVKSARVHLALPEQGLFRKESSKAKASVALVTKPGQTLSAAQVLGIQRLIAASVAEVRAEDVTITDQNGTTLSRSAAEEASHGPLVSSGSGLDLESHLTRKAADVLDKMFGAGQALVTVDVLLNPQQTRITTEEVLAATTGRPGESPTGVLVRERSSTRPAPDSGSPNNSTSVGGTSQEFEYQTGKRVTQVVSPSGNVSRINVAVVIKRPLSEAEMQRVREVVAASVGLQPSRGDLIALYSMTGVGVDGHAVSQQPAAARPEVEPPPGSEKQGAEPLGIQQQVPLVWWIGGSLGLLLILALGFILPSLRKNSNLGAARRLSERDRDAVLETLKQWLTTAEARS